jgi:tetratricopeptide (TPR) repeat protein
MSGPANFRELWAAARPGLRRRRPWIIWLCVFMAASLLACTQPLFNVLSYEFSLLMAVLVSFAGAHLGSDAVHLCRREDIKPAGAPLGALFRLYLSALWPVMLILLMALDIISANAAVEPNCNYLAGLVYYLILPVPSAVMAVAVGVTSGLLIRRRVLSALAAIGVVAVSLGWGVYRFYAAPPVKAYDPFVGFWTGNLYDALILVDPPWIWSRVFHLALAAALLFTTAWFYDRSAIRLRLAKIKRPALAAGSATLWSFVLFLFLVSGRLGFSMDLDDIARELGGRATSPHFVLHYTKGKLSSRKAVRALLDAEFRYAQLKRFFGAGPKGRIRILLFKSSMQKRRLMGAMQVEMAKPWRREIYIQSQGFPHPVLKHEMAHVFASAFGDRIFGVSFRWNFWKGFVPVPTFNPGLIEGAAVAADWSRRFLTPHQASRAMLELDLAPSMEDVMGYSFFATAAVRSYTMAGSFCRFLVERYGAKRFRRLYRSGGDFAAVYGVPLHKLSDRWKKFVRSVPLTKAEKAVAKKRLSRRSVFQRVCIHEIASLQYQAFLKPPRKAAPIYRRICRLDPADPDHLYDELDTLVDLRRTGEAWRIAGRIFQHPQTTKPLKALTLRLLGNLEWSRGNLARARVLYRKAARYPTRDWLKRDLAARLEVLSDPEFERALKPLFFFDAQKDEDADRAAKRIARLKALTRSRPRWGLSYYLVGSVLLNRGDHKDAARILLKSLKRDLPHPLMRREAIRRAGKALFLAGRHRQAAEVFKRLDRPGMRTTIRLYANDWMERCRWQEHNEAELRKKIRVY